MIKKVIAITLSGLLATTITAYGFSRNFHQVFAQGSARSGVHISLNAKATLSELFNLNGATTTGAAIQMIKACPVGSTTSAAITFDPNKNNPAITTGAAIKMVKVCHVSSTTSAAIAFDPNKNNTEITTGPAIRMFKVCPMRSTTFSAITTGAGIDMQNGDKQTALCINVKNKSNKECPHNKDKKGNSKHKQITKHKEKDDNNQDFENDHNNISYKITFSGSKQDHYNKSNEKRNKHSQHSNDNNNEKNDN